ncbi:auxin-induced in root cultures protein 12-like [Prunus yedoensis var. nudiflora]|uniref:Auxin-induced in root cultures protein 12-like n=1 Tax=Prunus yedoensis var. nudiflora TaxID=2094558 RepID=A0A314UBK0_PRUYE|nr:auxin-induced in root cultures protein 12-like [Prunus yedoensis var. nudiflora]
MASSLHTVLLVSVSWISLLALLISPAQAATCSSQTFKNKLYTTAATSRPQLLPPLDPQCPQLLSLRRLRGDAGQI